MTNPCITNPCITNPQPPPASRRPVTRMTASITARNPLSIGRQPRRQILVTLSIRSRLHLGARRGARRLLGYRCFLALLPPQPLLRSPRL